MQRKEPPCCFRPSRRCSANTACSAIRSCLPPCGKSLSATEAFSADIIHLLGSPTISQFAETIGISQPNATYKVNQLAAKGYLHKTVQAHDRREIVLTTSEKFSGYFDENEEEMQKKVAALSAQFTPEELCSAERVLLALGTLL